ncbi:unnamed protein product, partial [Staurois parvus]
LFHFDQSGSQRQGNFTGAGPGALTDGHLPQLAPSRGPVPANEKGRYLHIPAPPEFVFSSLSALRRFHSSPHTRLDFYLSPPPPSILLSAAPGTMADTEVVTAPAEVPTAKDLKEKKEVVEEAEKKENKNKAPENKNKAPENKNKAPENKNKAPENKNKVPENKNKVPENGKKAPENGTEENGAENKEEAPEDAEEEEDDEVEKETKEEERGGGRRGERIRWTSC